MTKVVSRVIGVIAFLLLFTVNATAQDKAAAGAKKLTEHMKVQLALNDSQYTKVHAVNLDFLTKAISANESGKTKIEIAKKIKQLDEERDAKLKSVLSDDQFKKFVATKPENRKKVQEHIKQNPVELKKSR